jgi:hypothetical protein
LFLVRGVSVSTPRTRPVLAEEARHDHAGREHRASEKVLVDYGNQQVPVTDPGASQTVDVPISGATPGASSYTYGEATAIGSPLLRIHSDPTTDSVPSRPLIPE